MQEILLSDQHELVRSPPFTGHWLIYIYLQSFRTRLDILMGHHFVLRGQSRRQLCLSDMSLVELPKQEGPQPCQALLFLLSEGKTNKVGRKEYMGSMRHKDPLLCSHSALAQYLFWRFHVSGEDAPSFQR